MGFFYVLLILSFKSNFRGNFYTCEKVNRQSEESRWRKTDSFWVDFPLLWQIHRTGSLLKIDNRFSLVLTNWHQNLFLQLFFLYIYCWRICWCKKYVAVSGEKKWCHILPRLPQDKNTPLTNTMGSLGAVFNSIGVFLLHVLRLTGFTLTPQC